MTNPFLYSSLSPSPGQLRYDWPHSLLPAADQRPDGAEPAADPGAEGGGRDREGAQGPDTEAGHNLGPPHYKHVV